MRNLPIPVAMSSDVMNDKARMTKDEGMTKREAPRSGFALSSSLNASPAWTIRHSSFLVAAVLVMIVFAIYAPAMRNGFVWDDTALVLRDPLIRSWRLIPEGFNHHLFIDATASDFYRPMQRLLYTADYAAVAFRPAFYHFTSILGHAAAAVALFFFAEQLLLAFGVEKARSRTVAFFASLLWAIHPVHSSAVIYVSGLADPLAAAFGFAGCYLVLRTLGTKGIAHILWLSAAGALFLLSVLSKESGFVFPAIAIALLAFLKNWKALWKLAVVAVFICTIYFNARQAAEHIPPPKRQRSALSVRPITMARAVAEYAGLIVLPWNLHMERKLDVQGVPIVVARAAALRELQTIAGLILIALAIRWAIRARNTNWPVFVLLALATIAYLPISGLWPLNASVAEHWLYLPSALLFVAVSVAMVDLMTRWQLSHRARATLSVVLAVWCLFLAGRTFIRCFDWKDQRTFLQRTLATGGDSVRMLTNLGSLESSEGNFELAKKYLNDALRKDPNEPFAVINLSTAALKEGDYKTARDLLERAKKMPEVEARAYENLAVLQNREHGRADIRLMHLASRTGPPDWSIEKRYILLLDEMGQTAAAMKKIDDCLTTQWYRAETWELLGKLLQKSGRASEGAVALNRARAFDVHLEDR